jgi:hypothetical protein
MKKLLRLLVAILGLAPALVAIAGDGVEVTIADYNTHAVTTYTRVEGAKRTQIARPADLSVDVPTTFGAQRTLLVLAKFADTTTLPWTVAQAQAVMAEDDRWYREVSYGGMSIAYDVAGWYTIAATHTEPNYITIGTQALAAAQAAGVDVASYPHRVIAFPDDSAIGWWGLGTVGGNPSTAYVNGGISLKVVAHEMGHNFGLWHSHSYACNGATCVRDEYGDPWDMMGGLGNGHFNAYQKSLLGWISPDVGTAGTYELQANEFLPRALRVGNVYVELHAKVGYDTPNPAGIQLHAAAPGGGSDLLDNNLGSGVNWILAAGQSFTNSTGTTITASTASSVTVSGDTTPTATPTTVQTATPTATPAATATPAPAGTFADDFNRADSASLGGSWSLVRGYLGVYSGAARTYVGYSGESAAVAPLSGADSTATATFTSYDNNLGPRFGVILRYVDALNYVLLYRQTGGTSQLRIAQVTNGVEKIIATANLANPQKGVPFTLKGSITGSTATVNVGTVTKSAVISAPPAGRVGFLIGNRTTTVRQAADNFTATTR